MKKYLILLISTLFFFNCSNNKSKKITYKYPKIESQVGIDSLYGKVLVDPFRNIENTNDSIITNWYKEQTLFANNFLNNISGRDSLTNSLFEINNRKSYKIKRVSRTDNNQIFFLKKEKNEKHYSLYHKLYENSESELLFNPIKYNTQSENKYVINYIKPSWNGQFIVVSLTHSGRQLSELIIIETKTKKILPQTLNNAWPTNFLGVNWLPDNSGFTFLYFPNTNTSDPKFRENSQSVIHFIKDLNGKIEYIFGNKLKFPFKIPKALYPTTKIWSSKDKYIIGHFAEADNYWATFHLKIDDLKKGDFNWKPLHKKSDRVMQNKGYFTDSSFIYLSAKNAENKKIMEVSVPDFNFSEPKTLVQENPEYVIDDFEVTSKGVFYSTLKNGVEAKLFRFQNGKNKEIPTPKKAGKINLYNTSAFSDDLWMTIKGWTSPNLRYKYNNETNSFVADVLYPIIKYPEFENIIVEEILVTSHDGVKVPFSIVYNKTLKKNNKNPVFIYGYGAHGDIESPYFSPIMLNFVKEGGVFGIAHVRGGGEKGDTWHKGGLKTTKHNTWRDLIACTEHLINEKFTSKEHTAIYGGSAGGIMVTRAIIERPDLFQVAISDAGYLNPFRAEMLGAAGSNTSEYGKVTDSLECLALINMDPYLQIKDSIDYPATYLTVGMNDAIVKPWMTGKFAARLQKSSSKKKPIFMLADFESGHDGSSDVMKIYKEWSTIFSFVLWQTGHPNYQLKN